MMELLTFLGVGNYSETEYTWQNFSHVSQFAPAASCRFLKPDTLIGSEPRMPRQSVFQDFTRALPKGLEVCPNTHSFRQRSAAALADL